MSKAEGVTGVAPDYSSDSVGACSGASCCGCSACSFPRFWLDMMASTTGFGRKAWPV